MHFFATEQIKLETHINYICIEFFESKGITPSQEVISDCEQQIFMLLNEKLSHIKELKLEDQ